MLKFLSLMFVLVVTIVNAQTGKDIILPKPKKSGGMPLMETLNNRQTIRSFDTKELSMQRLSDLLWAAWGINRDSGKRTAPSAMNKQEIDIYVALNSGTYLYDAQDHRLKLISDENVKKLIGMQDFVSDAAVNFIYVADYSKMFEKMNETEKLQFSWVDTGFISQNVYLFCASENLASVVIGMVQKEIREKLSLKENQHIIMGQCIGHKK